jgi:hypothetical protein
VEGAYKRLGWDGGSTTQLIQQTQQLQVHCSIHAIESTSYPNSAEVLIYRLAMRTYQYIEFCIDLQAERRDARPVITRLKCKLIQNK